MAANTFPLFVLTGFGSPVSVSTTSSDFTGGGTLTDIVTGGTNGTRVEGLSIVATGRTPDSGALMLIFHTSGATKRLLDFVTIPAAIQPDAVRPPWRAVWVNRNPGPLKNGDKISVCPTTGTTVYHVAALGGDY